MPESQLFLSGVIEGFYGRAWPLETRLAYADYLHDFGLNTYIYAPKSDSILRRQWQYKWPANQWRDLQLLSAHYRDKGILWGVGLSPLELYVNYGRSQKDALKRKVNYLAELEAPLLAVLFDDMPGDLADLAARQGEIVHDICSWVPGVRVLVCPTYYSFDPLLEQYFGKMPVDYWSRLGRDLPRAVDVFWTGNKVCSDSIGTEDLAAITDELGRRVILWDNYPVNDGAKRCNFLYLNALLNREKAMRSLISGHLCNPMNQGFLSLPALGGLAALYGHGAVSDEYLSQRLGAKTWELLSRDRDIFQSKGLAGLGDARCHELAAEYADLPGTAAAETVAWLRGDYAFDPDCLTG